MDKEQQIEQIITEYRVGIYEHELEANSNNNRVKDLLLWEDSFNLVELLQQEFGSDYFDPMLKTKIYTKASKLLVERGFKVVSTKRELQLKTDLFKSKLVEQIKQLEDQ